MDEYDSLLRQLPAGGVVAFHTGDGRTWDARDLQKGLNAIDERRLFGERFECDGILSMATASEVRMLMIIYCIYHQVKDGKEREKRKRNKKRKPPNRCQPLYISQ